MNFWEISRRATVFTTQVFALLVIVNVGIGTYSAFQQAQRTYQEQKGNSNEQRQKSAQEIATGCSILSSDKQLLRSCISNGIDARDKEQNTDRDLEVQQHMAFWAQAQFWLGSAGTLLSAFGLFFVWQSLQRTREAITTDREVGHAQVRAYVSIDIDVPKIYPDKVPHHEFKIRNTGQSPAYRLAYIAGFDILPNPMPNNIGHLGGKADGQDSPLLSIAANESTIGEMKGIERLTDEHIAEFLAGKSSLYLFVRAFYNDVFGKNHETAFCGRLDFELIPGFEHQNPRPWMVRMFVDQKRTYSD